MEPKIALSIPREDLSARSLSSVLRLIELLVALRSISPDGELGSTWAILYRKYVESVLQSVVDRSHRLWGLVFYSGAYRGPGTELDLESSDGTDSELFESWIAAEFIGVDLLPIEDIRHGSYEVLLQTINLAAVFGLQDLSLTKDLVQWLVAALGDLLGRKSGEAQTVRSGKAGVRISPELVRALHAFDKVTLTEERTPKGTTLKIQLSKNATGKRK